MADGKTPDTRTEPPRALAWDEDAVDLQCPRTQEASLSPPVSDGEVTSEGGRQTTPDAATASGTEVASIKSEAKVPDQPFRLMDLPLELRCMIFRELLVMPGPVFIKYVYREGQVGVYARPARVAPGPPKGFWYEELNGSNLIRQSSLLSIFSASKTIYRETVPLYFGCNHFDFVDLDRMEQFLNQVGAEYRWQIASISVRYYGKAPARAVKRLRECVGLRVLRLDITSYSFGRGDPNTPHETPLLAMKDLLRIRGLDSIDLSVIGGDSLYVSDTLVPTHNLAERLEKRLKVLTEPRDPKQLKRQEKKDFPTKAKRTIFGAANVVTRSEKKQMLETQR